MMMIVMIDNDGHNSDDDASDIDDDDMMIFTSYQGTYHIFQWIHTSHILELIEHILYNDVEWLTITVKVRLLIRDLIIWHTS